MSDNVCGVSPEDWEEENIQIKEIDTEPLGEPTVLPEGEYVINVPAGQKAEVTFSYSLTFGD